MWLKLSVCKTNDQWLMNPQHSCYHVSQTLIPSKTVLNVWVKVHQNAASQKKKRYALRPASKIRCVHECSLWYSLAIKHHPKKKNRQNRIADKYHMMSVENLFPVIRSSVLSTGEILTPWHLFWVTRF